MIARLINMIYDARDWETNTIQETTKMLDKLNMRVYNNL